ncbi:winged helix DNA-binding protein [Novosphingobium sp.]|uniref:winged helix DNA-binding protein n=1 Tax=Novosphingobium sp. TaxID=1874826 RepID=UPI00261B2D1A|nr:winged helix DNA-binding protein [Novosphingobium sp.]
MDEGKFQSTHEDAVPEAASNTYSTFPLPGVSRSKRLRSASVAVLSDRSYIRSQIAEDVSAAGVFRIETRNISVADPDKPSNPLHGLPFADIVIVDCAAASEMHLDLIEAIDRTAISHGSQLIVSTSTDCLDAVFACVTRCDTQILVSPTRADHLVALGQSLARISHTVRELSDEDRLTLIRLTEQVTEIAQKIEGLSGAANERANPSPAFSFSDMASDNRPQDEGDRLVRSVRPPLPDARLVRRIIRQRQLRARFFDGDLFADPAWDMLLDLTAARVEHTRVSVTSLCIASGVPPTTALRWIGQMTEAGLLERVSDEEDRRRAFLTLSDRAALGMARYFSEVWK